MSSTNPCITDGLCLSPTNLPEFIDTSACLCGLLPSAQPDPNGGYIELWRCLGNASDDLRRGIHGKWYNTTLPSQELVGINMPQNWGENGPDTSQAFVVVDNAAGNPVYKKLEHPNDSPSLIGRDGQCNGKNDTALTTQFYESTKDNKHAKNNGNGTAANSASASASSSNSLASASSSASSAASSSAATTTASGTAPASTAGSSTSASTSPSATGSSDAGRASVKGVFVVCMFLAPLFATIL